MDQEVYSGLLQGQGIYYRFVVYKDAKNGGYYETWETEEGGQLYIGVVGFDQLPSVAKET